MKKSLLTLLFVVVCVLPVPGWAQVHVVAQSAMKDAEMERLHWQYPAAIGPLEHATAKDMAFQKAQGDFMLDFGRFLHKAKFKLAKSSFLYFDGYFQANGQADIVVYRVSSDNLLTAAEEQQLTTLLTSFLSTHKLPVNPTLSSSPFQIFAGYNLPSATERIMKDAPGVIHNLATAMQTNRPDTVREVNFGGLYLETVPDVLYRFTNAEEVDLGYNYLTSLPARLSTLPNLKRLNLMINRLTEDSIFFSPNKHLVSINLQRNSLTRVPPAVRHNRRLESLWLGNNDLASLDVKPLRRLRRLTDLNLYNTGLTSLPKTIKRLKHVAVLDLYYNKLKELPRQMGKMKRLEQLAVSHNDLSQLTASLAKLRRLQKLYAHHNRISQLPDAFVKLNQLQILDLGYNWFTVAPTVVASLPALEELDLNNNNLQELPASLGTLKGLKKLYLRSNPLTRDDATAGPYAPIIRQLEANKTEVFY